MLNLVASEFVTQGRRRPSSARHVPLSPPIRRLARSTRTRGHDALEAAMKRWHVYATRRSVTTGKCFRSPRYATFSSSTDPGWPRTSACGPTEGDLRGQGGRPEGWWVSYH